MHLASINGVVRNEKILGDERESWIGEALETCRRRGDGRTQSPQSVGYAFLRDVAIIQQRGTKCGVICLIDANFLLRGGIVNEAGGNVGYAGVPVMKCLSKLQRERQDLLRRMPTTYADSNLL